jgi:acetyl-CoA synthetase
MSTIHSNIESFQQEKRLFSPPPQLAKRAWIKSRQQYEQMYRESIDQPEKFWETIASELHWFKKWDRVLDWKPPYATWFVGAKTNISYNCLDYQIERGRGDKTAILWEAEPLNQSGQPEIKKITYKQLRDDVCRFANGLKKLGVKKGDRVTIYMPMVPEAAVAMLACARLGAAHSVIFGGFSSQAIADRVEDAESSIVITADGGFRRGQIVPLKNNVDDAMTKTSRIKTVVVLKRTGQSINMQSGRDVW